jgi:hypothetical protein
MILIIDTFVKNIKCRLQKYDVSQMDTIPKNWYLLIG